MYDEFKHHSIIVINITMQYSTVLPVVPDDQNIIRFSFFGAAILTGSFASFSSTSFMSSKRFKQPDASPKQTIWVSLLYVKLDFSADLIALDDNSGVQIISFVTFKSSN